MRRLDSKLDELVKKHIYVPYPLSRNVRFIEDVKYWHQPTRRVFKYLGESNGYATVLFDGDKGETKLPMEKANKVRYELRPYEYAFDDTGIIDSGISYTAAEIEALGYIGILDRRVYDYLEETYFKNISYTPSPRTYYFVNSTEIFEFRMRRDGEKSPRIIRE